MTTPITAYVKPTNFCNVGCSHCYLPESVRANKSLMSFEMIEQVAQTLLDMAKRQKAPGIHVLWHGGEPLTVSADWYFEAGNRLDKILPGHSESIQTSLIPYRSHFAPLIKERFGSEIGSSIDFSQRTIKNNVKAYQDLWMDKVEMARKDGFLVIPGVVPTAAEVEQGTEITNWFLERDFPFFNIDRYNHFGGASETNDRPTNGQHSRFLRGLFDAMIENMEKKGTSPLINVLIAGIKGVWLDMPGDRWGTTCHRDFIVIEPDGATNNCPDKISFEKPYSFIQDGFSSFENSKERKNAIREAVVGHKRPHCLTCEFNTWCKSGCPITPNGYLDGEDECSGYKKFLHHVQKALNDDRRDTVIKYLDMSVQGPAAVTSYGGAA